MTKTVVKLPPVEEIEQAIDLPFDCWAKQCHSVSLAIVKSGVLGTPARVARGVARGVIGQHSWIVLGMDCYAPKARIVDPTLWSYDEQVTGIWEGKNLQRHRPHGLGRIWQWDKPTSSGGPVIELTPKQPLDLSARIFLDMLGPLDVKGWMMLTHAGVQGWPAKEILTAMHQTEQLKALIPVDKLGMATDLNPGGLYF